MILITIDTMLKARNKTVYWLSKQTGITQYNLSNLIKGKTTSVKFDNLDKICDALNCDISDIIRKVKD